MTGKKNQFAVAVPAQAIAQKAATPKLPLSQESAARRQISYHLHLLEMWIRHQLIMSITNL
jgi:hypothetical protein